MKLFFCVYKQRVNCFTLLHHLVFKISTKLCKNEIVWLPSVYQYFFTKRGNSKIILEIQGIFGWTIKSFSMYKFTEPPKKNQGSHFRELSSDVALHSNQKFDQASQNVVPGSNFWFFRFPECYWDFLALFVFIWIHRFARYGLEHVSG